jgi:tyrosinase
MSRFIPEKPHNEERRIVIKGLGAVGLSLIGATLFGGCESLIEKIKNRPVRRRLRTGSAAVDNDIAIYRQAVSLMKALPASDPRSWSAQAAIHGTAGVGFNFCQHNTPHFFSWHRAYLFYFEQICRELTGEANFALPYWNWNQNSAVHPAFLDSTSSLFDGSRINTSVAGVSNFFSSTLNPIFEDANFFTFSTQIEGTPHNRAHTHIGGTLGGFGSARDPLFWMHHCMVDYCWAKWNLELENDNTNDSGWNSTEWNHFVDGKGNPATISAAATTLMPLLSYRYECSPVGKFGCPLDLESLSAAEFKKLEARVKAGASVRFDIKKRISISRSQRLLVNRPSEVKADVSAADFATIVDADTHADRVFLSLDYAALPVRNDFFVRVFINLPEADERTSIESEHYAGSFSFFGTETGNPPHHHQHQPGFLINVTDTLRQLRRLGKLRSGEPISVQLVAIPEGREPLRADTTLQLRELAFIVSPVTIKRRD